MYLGTAPVRLELTTFRYSVVIHYLTVGRCNQLSHGACITLLLKTVLEKASPALSCSILLVLDHPTEQKNSYKGSSKRTNTAHFEGVYQLQGSSQYLKEMNYNKIT